MRYGVVPGANITQVASGVSLPVLHGDEPVSAAQLVEVNKRHATWLLKRSQAREDESFRPRKVYRMTTKKLMWAWDVQWATSTCHNGLSAIKPTWADPQWATSNWRNWICLGPALDQGSDNICSISAGLNKPELKLNWSAYWDPWHGVDNDIMDGFKHEKLYAFLLLSLVMLNLQHGNAREPDCRYWQSA